MACRRRPRSCGHRLPPIGRWLLKSGWALRFHCRDPEATWQAAGALARVLAESPEQGLILALVGPLGAGKTHFVKGLAAGLGVEPDQVASPTFVIVSQYRAGERMLAHVDLYRLQSAEDLDDVGFLDLLEPAAVVAVEWADRFPEALPRDRLELRVERSEAVEGSRSFTASATGEGSQRLESAWRKRLDAVVAENLELDPA
jgi:tRNA threonylcarbamoyladenosine biosynthesis protein TsaE